MDQIAQDGVEPWELDGARADVLAGLKSPAEARDWALSAQLLGVPDPAVALPPRLEALTPASVNAAIARWIHPERLSIAVVAREPEVYRAAFIEETGASGVQAGGYALGVKTLTVVSDEELNP